MHVEFQMTQLYIEWCIQRLRLLQDSVFSIYVEPVAFESKTKYEMILIYSVIYYVSLALIVKLFFIVCVHSHVPGRGNTNSGHHRNK